jgi:hypothetical protein
LKPEKVITGAHVAKVKHNLSAMAHIKVHHSHHYSIKRQKTKPLTSVDVRNQAISQCVTAVTASKQKPIIGVQFKDVSFFHV